MSTQFLADCGHLLDESDDYHTTVVRLGDGTVDDRIIECWSCAEETARTEALNEARYEAERRV